MRVTVVSIFHLFLITFFVNMCKCVIYKTYWLQFLRRFPWNILIILSVRLFFFSFHPFLRFMYLLLLVWVCVNKEEQLTLQLSSAIYILMTGEKNKPESLFKVLWSFSQTIICGTGVWNRIAALAASRSLIRPHSFCTRRHGLWDETFQKWSP